MLTEKRIEGDPLRIEIFYEGSKLGELYECNPESGMFLCTDGLREFLDTHDGRRQFPYGTAMGAVQWKERVAYSIGWMMGWRLTDTLSDFARLPPKKISYQRIRSAIAAKTA